MSKERKKSQDLLHEGKTFLKIANYLLTKSNSTLRQQERIFALTSLILRSFDTQKSVFPLLIFLLIFLKIMHNETFRKIERNEFSFQELSDEIYNTTYSKVNVPSGFNLIYLEALLLWFYNNNKIYTEKIHLFEYNDKNQLTTKIISKFENENSRLKLVDCFHQVITDRNWFDYDNVGLKYFIDKINLTEPFSNKI